MADTTELLLNITQQLGILLAKNENLEKTISSFKDELSTMRRDIRDHEDIHIELAAKRDVDAVWTEMRSMNGRIAAIEQKPGQDAVKEKERNRQKVVETVIGWGIPALISGAIAWIVSHK